MSFINLGEGSLLIWIWNYIQKCSFSDIMISGCIPTFCYYSFTCKRLILNTLETHPDHTRCNSMHNIITVSTRLHIRQKSVACNTRLWYRNSATHSLGHDWSLLFAHEVFGFWKALIATLYQKSFRESRLKNQWLAISYLINDLLIFLVSDLCPSFVIKRLNKTKSDFQLRYFICYLSDKLTITFLKTCWFFPVRSLENPLFRFILIHGNPGNIRIHA